MNLTKIRTERGSESDSSARRWKFLGWFLAVTACHTQPSQVNRPAYAVLNPTLFTRVSAIPSTTAVQTSPLLSSTSGEHSLTNVSTTEPEPPLPVQSEEPVEPEILPKPTPWAKTIRDIIAADKNNCRKLVSYLEPFDDCKFKLVGTGNAMVVTVIVECGGDSCSTKSWLLREDSLAPIELGELDGGFEFDPTLSYYVIDYRTFKDDADRYKNFYKRIPTLRRVELQTRSSKAFANCFSPALSPGAKWFVCRNVRGDVLRVPIEGGKLEMVVKNSSRGPVNASFYAFIYPESPYFYAPNEIGVRIEGTENDAEQKAFWSEGPLPGVVSRRLGSASAP